jgi:serine/threonine protein kinase
MTLPPPSPREINPKLSAEAERVLLRALNKSPEKRYASGTKLIDALERVLPAGRVPSARRTLREPPAPPTRARPAASPSDAVSVNLVGQQLDEYRLDALLGQGGMARIYRAYDTQRKRHVAIKVIDARFRADPDYVKRFQREARAIGQLDHPNIVKLYRYGEANSQLYIALQYVEGADLHSTLAARRAGRARLRPEEIAHIVRDVCLALDYAHGKGVIHRDVKPSNIILDKKGRALLTDFGLALLAESGTRGEIFGSPHYIAPEQAMSSARATPQSDVYAIGVILYEIFTGQVPFDAQDPLDIALLHMTEPPRPPRTLRNDVSPELEAVILKSLAKEPTDRYPTGAALADALDRALKSASKKKPVSPPVAALPPIPAAVARSPARQTRTATPTRTPAPAKRLTPAKPRERKRRAITLIVGFALLLILVAAGGIWWTNQNQSQATAGTATSVASSAASPTSSASALSLSTHTRTASPSPSATARATATSRPTARPTATRAVRQSTLASTLASTSPASVTPAGGLAATAETEFRTVWLPLIMRNYTIP